MAAKKRIEDFGTKIGAARKDLHARRATGEEVRQWSSVERINNITKANIWPTPDYAKMVNDGMDLGTAYVLKEVRDSIAPMMGARELAQAKRAQMSEDALFLGYAEMVSDIRDAVQKIRNRQEMKATFLELLQGEVFCAVNDEASILLKGYNEQRYPWATPVGLILRRHVAKNADWYHNKAETVAIAKGWPFIKTAVDKTMHALGLVAVEDADGTPGATFRIMCRPKRRLSQEELTTARALSTQRFGSAEEAMESSRAFVISRLEDIRKTSTTPQPEVRPMLEHVERTGPDYRGGRDVVEDDFQTQFGFRGGEFGNWLTQEDRQQTLNFAYDALCDLAAVLGVPDKAVSLDGTLAIAFGARGHGRASAHYEPGRKVFNLTKPRGAGTLAHEWFHALDHHLCERTGIAQAHPMVPFVTEYPHKVLSITSDTDIAIAGIRDNLRRICELHKTCKATIEQSIEKATEELNGVNHSIRSWFTKYTVDCNDGAYVFCDGVNRKTLGDADANEWKGMMAQLCCGEGCFPTFHAMDAFAKKHLGTGFSAKVRNANLNNNLPIKDARLSALKKAREGSQAMIVSPLWSSLVNLDKSRSKKYWTTKLEVAARAFEAWVYQEISSRGQKSDYLVHGVTNPEIYPTGEQLMAIKPCWDQVKTGIQWVSGAAKKVVPEATKLSPATRLWLLKMVCGKTSGDFVMSNSEWEHITRQAVLELSGTSWIINGVHNEWVLSQAAISSIRTELSKPVPDPDLRASDGVLEADQWANRRIHRGYEFLSEQSVIRFKDGGDCMIDARLEKALSYEDSMEQRECLRYLLASDGSRYGHANAVRDAVANGLPVSAGAAMKYGIDVPEVYRTSGNLLVRFEEPGEEGKTVVVEQTVQPAETKQKKPKKQSHRQQAQSQLDVDVMELRLLLADVEAIPIRM